MTCSFFYVDDCDDGGSDKSGGGSAKHNNNNNNNDRSISSQLCGYCHLLIARFIIQYKTHSEFKCKLFGVFICVYQWYYSLFALPTIALKNVLLFDGSFNSAVIHLFLLVFIPVYFNRFRYQRIFQRILMEIFG